MPSKSLTHAASIPSDYQGLLRKVKETLIEGQQRIEAERVRTYWETGRLIQKDILKHADRAEYGARVIADLARDLHVDKTQLARCIQFFKRYPRLPIVGGRQQLGWTHYRKLIAVPNDKERALLEEAASRNAWSADELALRIKSGKSEPQPEPAKKPAASQAPLTPIRGALYTYRIVERPTVGAGEEDSGPLLDQGFGKYLDVEGRPLKAGDMVQTRAHEGSYRWTKVDAAAKDLFTYQAWVERVIDGDTIKVRFDLGFKSFARETLRLRGIDCPELDTKAGQEARAFVQSYIKEAQRLVVRSSRSDKYDRYLADVFIPIGKESDPATDLFLNNLLLDQGHAQRM